MVQPEHKNSPSSGRFKVLGLLFLLTNITYLDRLCISAAAPAITNAFDFSPSQMGYIFSAFTLAYAAFEIPSGWLGDFFGTRKATTNPTPSSRPMPAMSLLTPL